MVVFDFNTFANINFMIFFSFFQEGSIRLICRYKRTFAMVLVIFMYSFLSIDSFH